MTYAKLISICRNLKSWYWSYASYTKTEERYTKDLCQSIPETG